jgi:toxin ParE1/3/4
MSLSITIAQRAEEDLALQYRWFVENADRDVAERYLGAVDQTIQRLANYPDLGLRRHYQSPELAGIRSFAVARPFEKHLIFYRAEDQLSIERVMHGARDLPRRLMEDPDG